MFSSQAQCNCVSCHVNSSSGARQKATVPRWFSKCEGGSLPNGMDPVPDEFHRNCVPHQLRHRALPMLGVSNSTAWCGTCRPTQTRRQRVRDSFSQLKQGRR